jgi:hypothetical protein
LGVFSTNGAAVLVPVVVPVFAVPVAAGFFAAGVVWEPAAGVCVVVEAGVCACAVASTSIPPVNSITANMFGLCITLVSHPCQPIANSARSKGSIV